ncbi:MAG: hypothetical protein K2Y02_04935 [Burkholderiaceae bacterium]|nr:hypothetical protein [Burkholderiaceae bacterium]
MKVGDLGDALASLEIDNDQRIRPKRGDEQPTRFDIDIHVVDASLHRRQLDSLLKGQRLRS